MLFEGAAGTGKSTSLLGALREHLAANPFALDQRVLALTKFHGSRRRMESTLRRKEGVGHLVDCVTLDSFAWHLVRRWRCLVRHICGMPEEGNFPAISSAAALLLRRPNVATWVGRRYPLVAVDELQDCTAAEVKILAGLTREAHLLCAADAFQDLSGSADCEAITWARSAGSVVALNFNHRTNVNALLRAARAVREGCPLGRGERNSAFEVVSCPKPAMGGGKLSWRLHIWGSSATIAVISPTKRGTSPFVDGVLAWTASNKARSSKSSMTAGPFRLESELADEQVCAEMVNALDLPADPNARLDCAHLEDAGRRIGAPDLRLWAEKERTLAGRQTVSAAVVRSQIEQIIRRRRAYGRTLQKRQFALTVHQAKNREFDSVVVLWPMRLQTDPEQQRRLLYNAITRAKRQVFVIVEDPKGDRLSRAPFA
jgi:hypothetical protein